MGLSNPLKRTCGVYPSTSKVVAPNPDPINFRILSTIAINNHLIARIKYPDCINFEGIKICVFLNTTSDDLYRRRSIDPHFADDDYSPIARFKPTYEGMDLALKLVRML